MDVQERTTPTTPFADASVLDDAVSDLPVPRTPSEKHRPTGQKRERHRLLTFALFVGLATFFFLLATGGPGTSPGVVAGLVAFFTTSVLVLFVFFLRRNQRAVALFNDAAGLLSRGDTERAIALMREVRERAGSNPLLLAMVNTHLGTAYMRQNDLGAAMTAFADAAYTRVPKPMEPALLGPPAYGLAASFGLTGDLDAAQAWLEKGDSYGPPALPVDGLLRTILWLRTGEVRRAQEYFDEKWNELELALPGASLREARLLRCFTEDQLGLVSVEQAIRDLGAARPDELAFLSASWPELRVYVRRLVEAGWGAGGRRPAP